MATKPTTKTIGSLHFEDLAHERFEDLCVQLFYPMKDWTHIHHWGRKGKDRGVDIAAEFSEGEASYKWAIQCKRYKTMSLAKMKEIINEFLKQNPGDIPDCYWLVVACNPSRVAIEGFLTHCTQIGMKGVKIISASILEAELYLSYPSLLYTFFGINAGGQRSRLVSKVKHRFAMKRRIEREFLTMNLPKGHPMIIHDVHRDNYPESDRSGLGISPWFVLEYHSTYHRGFCLILRIVRVFVNSNEEWRIVHHSDELENGWISIDAFQIANIPYDNIVEIDLQTDEYRNGSHLYCEFVNGGAPYEKIWHEPVERDQGRVFRLQEDSRIR